MSYLANLKKYLKEQVVIIRVTKKELKDYQKSHSGCDNSFFSKLYKLSQNYRHHHIAYSMLRGKSYETIERPKKSNMPNIPLIQEIRDAHTEKNVCISAS
jgi:hypothetical protein